MLGTESLTIESLTIESLTVHHRRIPLVRPFVTAVRTATAIDVVLVEAGASAILARSLVRNSAARMAVDCALYDLAAQASGIPLYRLLGGDHGTVRTNMTLSAGLRGENEEALIATAIEHRDAGFGTLKVKVGAGGDDVSVLRRVRAEVGADIGLRVDANQGWTAEQAVSVISAWEDAGLGIEMVEQPVAMDDLDALEFVTRHVNTPVLADEAVWTTRDLTEVIRRHAADMVNIKLAKTGGLREALRMAELARHNDIGVIVGCMMESHVGISAAASLACALEATAATTRGTAHDLDAGLWMKRSPVKGGAAYRRDVVHLPDAAGLGISELAAD